MEDNRIVDLYLQRNERALAETAKKYGGYCGAVATNILPTREDSEECVNDTWLAAWNDIPPSRPDSLKAYLGRLTRNLAISRYRFDHAKKRSCEGEVLLSELEDCLPGPMDVELQLERKQLGRLISGWLDGLSREERILFVRRYWYGIRVKQLAAEQGVRENRMAQRLLRLRKSLKAYLEQEGVIP